LPTMRFNTLTVMSALCADAKLDIPKTYRMGSRRPSTENPQPACPC
jgi:hypothetical protein